MVSTYTMPGFTFAVFLEVWWGEERAGMFFYYSLLYKKSTYNKSFHYLIRQQNFSVVV